MNTFCKRFQDAINNPNLTREELAEFGIWVDKSGNRYNVIHLPTGYLKNILPFTHDIMHRYVLGELAFRNEIC